MQNKLDPHFHLIHEEAVPDHSFLHMGAEVHVLCVFQIWQKRETKRPLIATRSRDDNLEFLPPSRPHEATIAFTAGRSRSWDDQTNRAEQATSGGPVALLHPMR